MNSKPMMSFLPLRESALKMLDPLGRWIDQLNYELESSVETLDLEGWFVREHDYEGGERI